MASFEPQDSNFEARVRKSFGLQTAMGLIGAGLREVGPGEVEIELPFRDDLCQQHGFIHGGVVTAIADTACGYAALSLMPLEAAPLTVEFKVNFMAPATGERLIARGRVMKPGRVLTVCVGDVVALTNNGEKAVATMLTTIMTVQERPDVPRGI